MKSKFLKIYKNYIDHRNSFLKELSMRKFKIKEIWTQSNNFKKNSTSKFKNSKKNDIYKNKKIFLNFNFSKFLSLEKINFSFAKKNSKKKLTQNNQSEIPNFLKTFDFYKLKSFISNKFNISLKSSVKDLITSQKNFNYIDKKIEKYLNFKISDLINKFKSKKVSISLKRVDLLVDLLGIYYANNKLYIAHLQKKDNLNIIKDIVLINVPSNLIGDYKIEKSVEVKGIINDMINVFGLNNPPIILFLSSSFFTTKSFSDSELVVFSEEDPIILSKSPYLPENTLVQYKRANGDKSSSYHRVVYANKEVIDSWINVISLTGSDIATITCPAIHLLENLINKSKKEICILCDIEDFTTSVYILRNNCELFSTRLPFGSSFYITDEESLNSQFFSRLDKSVKGILSENHLSFNDNIYLNGNGIDKMLFLNNEIKDGFIKIPKNKYKLNPDKSSDFNKENSVLNSFSLSLDIFFKKEITNNSQINRGQQYDQKKEIKEVVKNQKNTLNDRGENTQVS